MKWWSHLSGAPSHALITISSWISPEPQPWDLRLYMTPKGTNKIPPRTWGSIVHINSLIFGWGTAARVLILGL